MSKNNNIISIFYIFKKTNHKLYRNLKKKLYHIYTLKSTQHYIYIYVGEIGSGVPIYVYIGLGPNPRTLNSPMMSKHFHENLI